MSQSHIDAQMDRETAIGADALALAMEARCYRGGAHRTRMTELRLGARDFVAFGIVSLASLVALLPPGAWRAVR